MEKIEKVRLDKYLWSIRIFKTRSLATEAIEKGRVKLNENVVKPSKNVQLQDKLEIKTESRKWLLEVTGILDKRVAYTEAIKNYVDLTPPEDVESEQFLPSSFHTGKRWSKIGRPTKRDRRDIDEFLSD